MSKKLYIYKYVDGITTNYHDGGGLVIISASTPTEAWRANNERIAAEHPSNKVYLDAETIVQELPEPDRVIEVPDSESDAVIVFPNAGCC